MTWPHVVCMMLTADRQQYTERALECFRNQTYPNRSLQILDNGREPFVIPGRWSHEPISLLHVKPRGTIGELRNLACELMDVRRAEIVAHWDSDDWSHPLRLAESVEHLSASGADAFGYHSMFFYRRSDRALFWYNNDDPTHYIVGTSLVYWRKTWFQRPFPHKNNGEDTEWQRHVVRHSASSLPGAHVVDTSPRMIAELHSGNTTSAGNIDEIAKVSQQYRRRNSGETLVTVERLLGYEVVE